MNTINFFNRKIIINNNVVGAQQVSISGISIDTQKLTESLHQRLLEAEREKVKILRAALDHEFPIQDMVSDSYVTEEQAAEMSALVEGLTQKYSLTHIICFARKGNISSNFSVFTDTPSFTSLRYLLLIITKGTERLEHEIQDFVNAHCKSFQVSIISHGFETVRTAIAQGNRFFIAAFLGGLEIYYDNVTTFDVEFPKLNINNTLEKAEKRFHNHIKMATAFLYNAVNCIRVEEYFENGVFMLHQTVEQACIAMIKVHMGYRIDLHNLTRLLNLCRCFSDKPASVFFNDGDVEAERLFKILRESYGDTRYSEDFKVDEKDAIQILNRVDAFVNLAENLCLDYINVLRTKVGQEQMTNVYTINEVKD